ncbi:MAG: VCBS repeat-containing protein [Dokdonella sp.]
MNAIRCGRLAVTVALFCASPFVHANGPGGPRFVEIGHTVATFNSAAAGRFATADVDGDGIQDLVFGGMSGTPILFVLGKQTDGSIGLKQSKVVPDDGNLVRVLAWPVAATPHIVSVGANGIVRDYSGWPLAEQHSFTIAVGAVAAAIGDVDADGNDDLLLLTQDHLYAYAMATGQPEWNYAVSGATDLALAQLDADPALEIILGGISPGLVLDGATRATDWQYVDGFGVKLATGALSAGGGTQWVGAEGWSQFTVFRAMPWSPLWSGTASQDIGAIATADLDNNGHDVILLGDGQWGAVHVYDSNTHQQRLQIPNSGWGINAVASADLDGDGVPEIAFAAAEASLGDSSLLTVADSRSGVAKWQLMPASGPFVAAALGDVDGDGREELVTAVTNGSLPGTIAVFDAQTGIQKWRSPASIGNANDPFYMSTANIKLIPHTTTPGMDIVLAGTSFDGRIVVVDGTTMAVKLQIGAYASGPMQSRAITDLALFDFNGDGTNDFVVATHPVSTGATGAELQVFSGVDGHPLWTSVAMGSGFAGINGVLVTNTPGNAAGSELVAVLPDSLRAYNSQTQLLDWVLAATCDGATYVPHGVNGPEIAVFVQGGALTFYDASTQAYLRSYVLPAPLRAITALDGDVHALVASTGDALALIDGSDGTIHASSDYLGADPALGNQLAVLQQGGSVWHVAAGSQAAMFRYRLELSDRIFADSFDSH